ncbi:hypothetical protein KIPB_000551 [Kipferlia bialata]|uniref:PKD/REJ-like domain-containing protein n=1 Tax=Kipferlia bialata TaxID=797122 RepID=A0A9K3CQP9_9EUKA|nr:hypothetical protein KIPB_000551 [Kipferlia bialata]|eukprot:g551.t1
MCYLWKPGPYQSSLAILSTIVSLAALALCVPAVRGDYYDDEVPLTGYWKTEGESNPFDQAERPLAADGEWVAMRAVDRDSDNAWRHSVQMYHDLPDDNHSVYLVATPTQSIYMPYAALPVDIVIEGSHMAVTYREVYSPRSFSEGHICLFSLDETDPVSPTWTLRHTLRLDDYSGLDEWGYNLALSDSSLVTFGDYWPSLLLWHFPLEWEGDSVSVGDPVVLANPERDTDSAAVLGSTLMVGGAGEVVVYDTSLENWSQNPTHTLSRDVTEDGRTTDGRFGYQVSMTTGYEDQGRVAISQPDCGDSGIVHIYECSDEGLWTFQQSITNGQHTNYYYPHWFGYRIVLRGSTLAVVDFTYQDTWQVWRLSPLPGASWAIDDRVVECSTCEGDNLAINDHSIYMGGNTEYGKVCGGAVPEYRLVNPDMASLSLKTTCQTATLNVRLWGHDAADYAGATGSVTARWDDGDSGVDDMILVWNEGKEYLTLEITTPTTAGSHDLHFLCNRETIGTADVHLQRRADPARFELSQVDPFLQYGALLEVQAIPYDYCGFEMERVYYSIYWITGWTSTRYHEATVTKADGFSLSHTMPTAQETRYSWFEVKAYVGSVVLSSQGCLYVTQLTDADGAPWYVAPTVQTFNLPDICGQTTRARFHLEHITWSDDGFRWSRLPWNADPTIRCNDVEVDWHWSAANKGYYGKVTNPVEEGVQSVYSYSLTVDGVETLVYSGSEGWSPSTMATVTALSTDTGVGTCGSGYVTFEFSEGSSHAAELEVVWGETTVSTAIGDPRYQGYGVYKQSLQMPETTGSHTLSWYLYGILLETSEPFDVDQSSIVSLMLDLESERERDVNWTPPGQTVVASVGVVNECGSYVPNATGLIPTMSVSGGPLADPVTFPISGTAVCEVEFSLEDEGEYTLEATLGEESLQSPLTVAAAFANYGNFVSSYHTTMTGLPEEVDTSFFVKVILRDLDGDNVTGPCTLTWEGEEVTLKRVYGSAYYYYRLPFSSYSMTLSEPTAFTATLSVNGYPVLSEEVCVSCMSQFSATTAIGSEYTCDETTLTVTFQTDQGEPFCDVLASRLTAKFSSSGSSTYTFAKDEDTCEYTTSLTTPQHTQEQLTVFLAGESASDSQEWLVSDTWTHRWSGAASLTSARDTLRSREDQCFSLTAENTCGTDSNGLRFRVVFTDSDGTVVYSTDMSPGTLNTQFSALGWYTASVTCLESHDIDSTACAAFSESFDFHVAEVCVIVDNNHYGVSPASSSVSGVPTILYEEYSLDLVLADHSGTPISADLSPSLSWTGIANRDSFVWNQSTGHYSYSGVLSLEPGTAATVEVYLPTSSNAVYLFSVAAVGACAVTGLLSYPLSTDMTPCSPLEVEVSALCDGVPYQGDLSEWVYPLIRHPDTQESYYSDTLTYDPLTHKTTATFTLPSVPGSYGANPVDYALLLLKVSTSGTYTLHDESFSMSQTVDIETLSLSVSSTMIEINDSLEVSVTAGNSCGCALDNYPVTYTVTDESGDDVFTRTTTTATTTVDIGDPSSAVFASEGTYTVCIGLDTQTVCETVDVGTCVTEYDGITYLISADHSELEYSAEDEVVSLSLSDSNGSPLPVCIRRVRMYLNESKVNYACADGVYQVMLDDLVVDSSPYQNTLSSGDYTLVAMLDDVEVASLCFTVQPTEDGSADPLPIGVIVAAGTALVCSVIGACWVISKRKVTSIDDAEDVRGELDGAGDGADVYEYEIHPDQVGNCPPNAVTSKGGLDMCLSPVTVVQTLPGGVAFPGQLPVLVPSEGCQAPEEVQYAVVATPGLVPGNDATVVQPSVVPLVLHPLDPVQAPGVEDADGAVELESETDCCNSRHSSEANSAESSTDGY